MPKKELLKAYSPGEDVQEESGIIINGMMLQQKSKIVDLEAQVKDLTERLEMYEKDSVEGSISAFNYQINCLNKLIRESHISLDDKDNKSFDRFWKIVTEMDKVYAVIEKLEAMKVGDEDSEKDKPKKTGTKNIMNNLINNDGR